MAFGPKIKTASKLASVNMLVRHDADIRNILNKDAVLIGYQVAMKTILLAIRAKFVGASGGPDIVIRDPWPTDKARFMGELSMDTVTKGEKNGKTTYTYDHAALMRENANGFRGRTDDIIKYFSMENDLTQSPNKPNPGGIAGTHNPDADTPAVAPAPIGVGATGGG